MFTERILLETKHWSIKRAPNCNGPNETLCFSTCELCKCKHFRTICPNSQITLIKCFHYRLQYSENHKIRQNFIWIKTNFILFANVCFIFQYTSVPGSVEWAFGEISANICLANKFDICRWNAGNLQVLRRQNNSNNGRKKREKIIKTKLWNAKGLHYCILQIFPFAIL